MRETRPIRKVSISKPTLEGAGVHLRRAFGFSGVRAYDPFLLLDDFRSDTPAEYLQGFPWHPHRGIETITYMLRGSVEHGDSLGNHGEILAGDVQWMTAGSGIIHQEMPKGDAEGAMHGFQLWANLPASHKMMPPRYQEVKDVEIPVVHTEDGARIRVICGAVGGVRGPVQDIITDPEYLDITVRPESEFFHATPRGYTALAYVIGGKGLFCHQKDPFAYEVEGANYFDTHREGLIGNHSLVLFGEGEQISVTTGEDPVRFLFISGKPLGEPIAWYGPIVMNTQEELALAFEELQQGTFIKTG